MHCGMLIADVIVRIWRVLIRRRSETTVLDVGLVVAAYIAMNRTRKALEKGAR